MHVALEQNIFNYFIKINRKLIILYNINDYVRNTITFSKRYVHEIYSENNLIVYIVTHCYF